MNILNLTSKQLKQAAKIKDKIADLESELLKLAGGIGRDISSKLIRKGKRRMSAAGRLAIAAAQRLRWSKVKRNSKPKTGKRKMSAAGRAKIAAAAKARWAKAKAAGKNSL
jgi:hypothetical protein